MLFRLVLLGLFAALPAAASEPLCTLQTPAGQTCSCDVRALRPLQGALGQEEVKEKFGKIKAKPDKEWRELGDDPIKVVRGPGDALFITDHHHGAEAWRLAGHPIALCQLAARPPFDTEAAFWQGLVDDRLVHLEDAEGKPVMPQQLPSSLGQMPDDPYRSLAWRLRKAGGFCRSGMTQKEFAEFVWADWMRARPELPAAAVAASAGAMVPAALALARSPAAKDVPGYVGDKPAGFTCAKES